MYSSAEQSISPSSVNYPDRRQWTIGLLCFLIIVVDGFDTSSIAYVAPVLSKAWGLGRGAIAPAFICTSVGAVLGYLLSGRLVRQFGRRRLIALSIAIFGTLTICTAYVDSLSSLSLLRLLTAVGLGCTVPAAISFAADHSTDNHRASVTIAVTTGLSFGAAAGGILSSYLIGHFGWRSVFISGGVLALLLLPFVWKHMYETSYPSRDRAGIEKADFTSLFRDGATSATSLIWLLAFVSFLVTYLFMFWVPTLLASFGFSPTQAPLGSGAFGLGGVTGNVVLIPLVRRFGPQRLVIAMSLLAICCLGGLAFGDFHATVVLLLIAGVGAGVVTACVSQSTLAVLCYPRGLRTIGLGSAAAVGRLGSVVGPALGGALMADGIAPRMIMLAACVPVLLVILILAASWKAERRT